MYVWKVSIVSKHVFAVLLTSAVIITATMSLLTADQVEV